MLVIRNLRNGQAAAIVDYIIRQQENDRYEFASVQRFSESELITSDYMQPRGKGEKPHKLIRVFS